MKIILISGKARSGKDTAAEMMRKVLEEENNSSVLITHYADLVKYVCEKFFGWDGKKDEAGRTLLQYVGTDVVRNKYPEYWVGFVASILDIFPHEWDYVIIPDCRFPNEYTLMKESFGNTMLVRVDRKENEETLTKEQKHHISETAMDDFSFDYFIHNNGTYRDLEQEVKELLSVIS